MGGSGNALFPLGAAGADLSVMAYIPANCEYFVPCRAGWICCGCGHFNGARKPACYNCAHTRCSILLQVPGGDRRSAHQKLRGRKLDVPGPIPVPEPISEEVPDGP